MCRVFGFRSVLQSGVHQSLIGADNNLRDQSVNHPDGWGVAYYVEGSPHVVKSHGQALNDSLFKKVSGLVSSETVLAHIRKSTLGETSILNTHPFQYGKWIFAHNGNIKNFSKHKSKLLNLIDTHLKKYILGETDSEVIFYILLTQILNLTKQELLNATNLRVLINKTVKNITDIIGDLSRNNDGPAQDNYLTFIITDGKTMLAYNGGKDLYYSTYKKSCSEKLTCPSYMDICERAVKSGKINHMIFSSEPLLGENIWMPLKFKNIFGVDANMNLITS